MYDVGDISKLATVGEGVPVWAPSPGGPAWEFLNGISIADIVSVNGKPARGVMVRRGTSIQLRPSAVSGQVVSDAHRSCIDEGVWESQQAHGTPIGTVTTHRFIGGGRAGSRKRHDTRLFPLCDRKCRLICSPRMP